MTQQNTFFPPSVAGLDYIGRFCVEVFDFVFFICVPIKH